MNCRSCFLRRLLLTAVSSLSGAVLVVLQLKETKNLLARIPASKNLSS